MGQGPCLTAGTGPGLMQQVLGRQGLCSSLPLTPASSACAAGRLQGLPGRLLQALMLTTKQPSRNPKAYSPPCPAD